LNLQNFISANYLVSKTRMDTGVFGKDGEPGAVLDVFKDILAIIRNQVTPSQWGVISGGNIGNRGLI
jgi:hypothetical protein